MYSTCLFCSGDLGTNEAIELFPVGRRLAFDSAKGRLWVVCRRCERWNLTPLEERWEAIEQCERAFRDTRLRVSTDQIGLARLREGLELVRIGAPQRPEMAAWRYGDQFGRRRQRAVLIEGAAAAAAGALVVAGPVLGAVTLSASSVTSIVQLTRALYLRHSVAARIPHGAGAPLVVPRDALPAATLKWNASERLWSLNVAHRRTGEASRRWWMPTSAKRHERTTLVGEEALVAARHLLPALNANGASRGTVRAAVDLLVETPAPESVFTLASQSPRTRALYPRYDAEVNLHKMTHTVRLALEMAAHEESERRALEGELHLLEAEWRNAEEIAGIADDMFLPDSVETKLDRLKRQE